MIHYTCTVITSSRRQIIFHYRLLWCFDLLNDTFADQMAEARKPQAPEANHTPLRTQQFHHRLLLPQTLLCIQQPGHLVTSILTSYWWSTTICLHSKLSLLTCICVYIYVICIRLLCCSHSFCWVHIKLFLFKVSTWGFFLLLTLSKHDGIAKDRVMMPIRYLASCSSERYV